MEISVLKARTEKTPEWALGLQLEYLSQKQSSLPRMHGQLQAEDVRDRAFRSQPLEFDVLRQVFASAQVHGVDFEKAKEAGQQRLRE